MMAIPLFPGSTFIRDVVLKVCSKCDLSFHWLSVTAGMYRCIRTDIGDIGYLSIRMSIGINRYILANTVDTVKFLPGFTPRKYYESKENGPWRSDEYVSNVLIKIRTKTKSNRSYLLSYFVPPASYLLPQALVYECNESLV